MVGIFKLAMQAAKARASSAMSGIQSVGGRQFVQHRVSKKGLAFTQTRTTKGSMKAPSRKKTARTIKPMTRAERVERSNTAATKKRAAQVAAQKLDRRKARVVKAKSAAIGAAKITGGAFAFAAAGSLAKGFKKEMGIKGVAEQARDNRVRERRQEILRRSGPKWGHEKGWGMIGPIIRY